MARHSTSEFKKARHGMQSRGTTSKPPMHRIQPHQQHFSHYKHHHIQYNPPKHVIRAPRDYFPSQILDLISSISNTSYYQEFSKL